MLIRAAEFAADCADFADEDWLGDAWSGPPEPQPVTAKAATVAQANTGATRRSRSAATGLVGMRLISMEGCSAPDADSGGRLVLQGPCRAAYEASRHHRIGALHEDTSVRTDDPGCGGVGSYSQ